LRSYSICASLSISSATVFAVTAKRTSRLVENA